MSKLHYVQHHDDEGIDEIVMMLDGEPRLRAVMVPRYKTSGMSGDEWRVSAMWQARFGGGEWVSLDGPYHSLAVAGSAIFGGVYASHPNYHALPCTSIRLLRKGRPVIELTHDGRTLPLLVALGHLPWTLLIWNEQLPPDAPAPFGGDATRDLCFQVGCSEPAVSTYALKSRFSRDGTERPAESRFWGRDAVRFCQRHLRRGDCGLEDADRNYDVLEGPGPDGHCTLPTDVSRSRVVLPDGTVE